MDDSPHEHRCNRIHKIDEINKSLRKDFGLVALLSIYLYFVDQCELIRARVINHEEPAPFHSSSREPLSKPITPRGINFKVFH